MLKEIFKNIDFRPLNSYMEKLETRIIDIDLSNKDIGLIICKLESNLKMEISILNSSDKIWIGFYFKTDTAKEKLEFMIYKNKLEEKLNRIIRHDYWILEDDILTTHNSFYTYLDNNFKSGSEKNRKIYLKDSKKSIHYDNLNNLQVIIDNSNVPILFKEDNKIFIEPNIETIMLKNIKSKEYKSYKY